MTSKEELLKKENLELKQKLQERDDALQAIQRGEVDAIVVKTPKGDQLFSIVSPDQPYQLFIDQMGEAALVVSNDGDILYANPCFHQMIGISEENILGSPLINYIKENDRSIFLQSLKDTKPKKHQISFVTKDQKTITTSMSISQKDANSVCILLTDITSLKRAQLIIETSDSITKILSDAPNLSTALKKMIEILQNYLGWDVVVLWEWDKDKQTLFFTDIAHVPDIEIEEFIKSCKELATNKALITGHVWSSYRPLWIEDVTEDPKFLRRNAAKQNNLRGALAFPFYKESQLAGIIELFSKAPFVEEVDDQLLNLVTSIGIEIGNFMQRKAAESTKAQFSTIVSYSGNGIYSLNTDGIVQSWNASAEKIYGWKADEILGKTIKQIYPKEKLNEYDEIRRELLTGKSIQRFQSQRVKKDGSLIWVENTYGPIFDAYGKPVGCCVITQDITADKSIAKIATQTQLRLQTFVDMSEEWVWEIDPNGNFTFSNPYIFNLLGFSTEEILGRNITHFLFPEDIENFEKHLRENISQRKGWIHLQLRFQHRNKTEVWTQCSAVGILNESEQLIGFQGICQDISQMRNLEKIKNEFISVVSHELRTPLSSVLGALSLMKSTTLGSKEYEELLELSLRNSEKLAALINNVLDAEKLQLGTFEYHFEKMHVQKMVLESMDQAEAIANKFNIKIEKLPPFADAEIQGDKSRLIQVMMNLLSNAIKFSPKPSMIHISIEDKENTVVIAVRDYGTGIPKEFQAKIFSRFSQADSSSRRTFQGTGLGLSICKSIVEDHKGTLSYKSEPGEGTTFFVEIPKIKQD